MPIYAYKCESCGHAKDVLQKMSDPLLTDCPVCGAPTFKKQLTAAGFQLKGSGWYATDFKNGGATSGTSATSTASQDKTDSGATTKSDTATGESKSDSKVESKAESGSVTKAESKPSDSASSKPPAASGGGCASGCGCH